MRRVRYSPADAPFTAVVDLKVWCLPGKEPGMGGNSPGCQVRGVHQGLWGSSTTVILVEGLQNKQSIAIVEKSVIRPPWEKGVRPVDINRFGRSVGESEHSHEALVTAVVG